MPRPRVTAVRAPLTLALTLLVGAALLVALLEAVLGGRAAPAFALGVAAYPVVGFLFVVVGALAWRRRPDNRTGFLLATTGLSVFAAAAQNIDDPVLLAVGLLAGQTPIVAAAHLTLAFPAGRVRDRWDLGAVVVGYVSVVGGAVPAAFPSLPDVRPLADVLLVVRLVVFSAAGIRAIVRAVRTTGAGSIERHVMVAVTVFGGALQVFFVVTARIVAPLLGLGAYQLFVVQLAVFAVTPFVYAAGVFRGGFGRSGELTELAAWLGSHGTRHSLRAALADVLGDPSLKVVFADSDRRGLVDADGLPAAPEDSPTRGTVLVRGPGGGPPSAAVVYDRTLIPDPTVVERAGRVVALALERDGLDALLLAEREALKASRNRVVEVADLGRRQLAQDLHDVLQSRLTLAALEAGRLAAGSSEVGTRLAAATLRDDLDRLISEFREVVHGVMPALLVERGLAAAAEDLVDRQPVPTRLHLVGAEHLPARLATTAYFILAEALTNAVRHARARAVDVVVVERAGDLLLEVGDDGVGGADPRAPGVGLRGIADRVDACGGTLHIVSPAGGGTRLTVQLPCAS